MGGRRVSSPEDLRIDSNQYTCPSMAKPKGKNPDDFVWRSNSLQERRQMRKKRNKKKRRELVEKKRKRKKEKVQARLAQAHAETKQYKKLATKYLGLWKRAIQRKDDKVMMGKVDLCFLHVSIFS